MLPFHQCIDEGGASGVIIEVFEVHLEEVDLLLHLLENNPVVPVLAGLLENSHEEELVQTTDLVNVHEDRLRLLPSYDLLVQQGSLEVRNHDAEVSNVVLFGLEQLSDDHPALEEIFHHLSHALTREDPAKQGLNLDYCLGLAKRGVGLHGIILWEEIIKKTTTG